MSKTYRVTGMTCGGCARSVESAIKAAVPGAKVTVDVAAGRVTVDGSADETIVAKAVDDAGFTFAGAA
ncbi:MAG: heavy-metal-associated domain-containing protein [Rhodospirillales bacterium]|nr:heavy-metal-associated domain-containing protein [Rhodospirillales bacterium]